MEDQLRRRLPRGRLDVLGDPPLLLEHLGKGTFLDSIPVLHLFLTENGVRTREFERGVMDPVSSHSRVETCAYTISPTTVSTTQVSGPTSSPHHPIEGPCVS